MTASTAVPSPSRPTPGSGGAEMAGLRAAQKQMTRKLLLDSALELFRTKGYAATTVDDIAAAAGTTRVTFYAYFPSRSDLMRALIGELNEKLERIDSPVHGSTARRLVEVVHDGSREAITEWLYGISGRWEAIRPTRWPPSRRRRSIRNCAAW
ncbi:TetR/AcrR family transcriptional regulator [Streptomyces sp. INA 01156]